MAEIADILICPKKRIFQRLLRLFAVIDRKAFLLQGLLHEAEHFIHIHSGLPSYPLEMIRAIGIALCEIVFVPSLTRDQFAPVFSSASVGLFVT